MLHLQPNLRRLCGWQRRSQIPSAATFSRAFRGVCSGQAGRCAPRCSGPKACGQVTSFCTSAATRPRSAPANALLPQPKAEPAPPKKRGRPQERERCAPAAAQRAFRRQMEQSAMRPSRICPRSATRHQDRFQRALALLGGLEGAHRLGRRRAARDVVTTSPRSTTARCHPLAKRTQSVSLRCTT
jgi:hypothetical protein